MILILPIGALIVAWIATQKGRSFLGWFIYGFLLLPIAFFHAIFMGNKSRKCPDCRSAVDIEASVCPHCKHKFTAEEIKKVNDKTESSNRNKIITVIVVFALFYIPYTLVSKDMSKTTVPTNQSEVQKKIPFTVINNGSLSYIIVEPKYSNIESLTELGNELNKEYADTGFIRISIFDDKRALDVRERVVVDQASKQENSIYDAHYVGQYNKNSSTNYNSFTIFPMKDNKIVNF